MRREVRRLIVFVGLALGAGLSAPESARAHRLEAEYCVLPGHRVQIESWFDLTGDSPKGAVVQVFRSSGQLLTEGHLSDKGIFVFPYVQAERLKIVVSAGAGHRKELEIPEAALTREPAESRLQASTSADGELPDADPTPLADRNPRVSLKDALIGVSFLLALAAFVLSLKNARRLTALKGPPD
jgi:hypothetical protein